MLVLLNEEFAWVPGFPAMISPLLAHLAYRAVLTEVIQPIVLWARRRQSFKEESIGLWRRRI